MAWKVGAQTLAGQVTVLMVPAGLGVQRCSRRAVAHAYAGLRERVCGHPRVRAAWLSWRTSGSTTVHGAWGHLTLSAPQTKWAEHPGSALDGRADLRKVK